MIVIAMAGRSRRFTEAGYAVPKYRLELLGRPVFDYAVGSLRARFGQEAFLFALGADPQAESFVRDRVQALGVPEAHTVHLGRTTAGQAETVALALDRAVVPADTPVTVFNIDTFRPGFYMTDEERRSEGFLEVFRDHGDNWSFIEPSENNAAADTGWAVRVLEKQRISDLCSTGLYYFRTRRIFEQAYHDELSAASQNLPEQYVAPIYNKLISKGLDVRYRVVDRSDVIFCGTPEEYEALRRDPKTIRRCFD